MGGPCLCNGKAVTPGTDNFEIVPFEIQGVKYYSAEQAYQALKMRKNDDRAKIAKCVPKPGEKGWDHGMRVWQAGQLGAARKDWEAVKVEAMYFANKCKLEQNPAVLSSLLESNGAPQGKLTHKGSGKFWDTWNPILLMLLREELSPAGGNAARIDEIRGQMEAYRVGKGGRSLLAELGHDSTAGASAASAAPEPSGDDGAQSSPIEDGAPESPPTEEVQFEGNVLELFRHFDVDGDGTIDSDRLLSILRKIDASWTEERVDRILASADVNNSVIRYEALVSRIFLDACDRLSQEVTSGKV